jgi:hypothetical protein
MVVRLNDLTPYMYADHLLGNLGTHSSSGCTFTSDISVLQRKCKHPFPRLSMNVTRLSMSRFHIFAAPRLNSGNASKSFCFIWYIYTAVLAQLHTTAVEIILAARGMHFFYSQSCAVGDLANISICIVQQKSPHRYNIGVVDVARVYNVHGRGRQILP